MDRGEKKANPFCQTCQCSPLLDRALSTSEQKNRGRKGGGARRRISFLPFSSQSNLLVAKRDRAIDQLITGPSKKIEDRVSDLEIPRCVFRPPRRADHSDLSLDRRLDDSNFLNAPLRTSLRLRMLFSSRASCSSNFPWISFTGCNYPPCLFCLRTWWPRTKIDENSQNGRSLVC